MIDICHLICGHLGEMDNEVVNAIWNAVVGSRISTATACFERDWKWRKWGCNNIELYQNQGKLSWELARMDICKQDRQQWRARAPYRQLVRPRIASYSREFHIVMWSINPILYRTKWPSVYSDGPPVAFVCVGPSRRHHLVPALADCCVLRSVWYEGIFAV